MSQLPYVTRSASRSLGDIDVAASAGTALMSAAVHLRNTDSHFARERPLAYLGRKARARKTAR
jgi:hypothetical protein